MLLYFLPENCFYHLGKGIISKAIKQAVDIAFETYDIDRVFARSFGTNIASQKVLEMKLKRFKIE